MHSHARVTVRAGLVRILEETRSRGAVSDFCDRLRTRIEGFLENLKQAGILDHKTITVCHVLPQPDLHDRLIAAMEREDLMQSYQELTGDPPENAQPAPGIYICESCLHKSEYKQSELLDDRTPICPSCGDRMEIIWPEGFDPYHDVEDVLALSIHMDDFELNEIMQEALRLTEQQLEGLYEIVGHALHNKSRGVLIRTSLERQYKEDLPIPQVWEQILQAINEPLHEDSWMRTRCWLLALAKAMGVIDDFNFSIADASEDGHSVNIVILHREDPVFDGHQKEDHVEVSRLSMDVCFRIFNSLLAIAEDKALIPSGSGRILRHTLALVNDKWHTLPGTIVRSATSSMNPMDFLSNTCASIDLDIESEISDKTDAQS